ncbi:endo-alpha-N-acetylgalactosaminidase family protein [Arcanobacterium hippocoleae]
MRPRKWSGAVAACTMIALAGIVPAARGAAAYEYTPIEQAGMKAVAADSTATSGEGTNGPIALVIDGKTDTYWHTEYASETAPLPHWFVIDLGAETENVGRVTLLPRQSSNGSGRVGEYQVELSTDEKCAAADTAETAQYTLAKAGSVPAAPEAGKLAAVNIDFTPAAARCVKVTYKSSWGGNDSSENVASLAEFGAATAAAASAPDLPTGNGPEIVVPENALEITDGTLTVRTHPNFPQVVDYRLGDKQLAGKYGEALQQITLNGSAVAVTVGTPEVSSDKSAVTYPLTAAAPSKISLQAVLSVQDGVLNYELRDIKDPDGTLRTIAIPGLDLVSLNGKDASAQIYAARISVDRAVSGDRMINVRESGAASGNAFMITAANSELAAGFETNAIGADGGSLAATDSRFSYAVSAMSGQNVGKISPASWVYRSAEVAQYDQGSGIGVDPNPMVKVKIVADANNDQKIDWQDGATAVRDVLTPANGRDDIKNYVVMRIPFNIVSQATHPFLRTLDDTKRISLATDNLGQEVLLKGYQAEGHDSAQGDYGGNYNERAGGLKDLQTLVAEGKNWNAAFGIHVNATETYSEANCFADANNPSAESAAAPCEVNLPPGKAWGWMNQAYYMNEKKDLATGNVLKRLQQLRADFPADSNLNWLYWDVYYKHGWQAQRFAYEMQRQGWRLGSEWAYSMPQYSTWSHWATDEKYGGQNQKGINSKLIRYVENSYRDTFNPDPMLGNANIIDFEGWTGHVNYNEFIKNVWERNLPVKFLQQSHIRTWKDGEITFENGTVVTSAQSAIGGGVAPVNRTINYDGATVFKNGGSYLLPWKNGGTDRLYYWNPGNSAQTWQLTNQFKNQRSLTLFKLTDTGREKVADLAVSGGTVNIPATAENTAYALYPTSAVPAVKDPNWGQGSGITDPGFFSENLDAYKTTGRVTIEKSDRNNAFAQLGAGAASLSQNVKLNPGTYSAWAWIEIQPGKKRKVAVSVSGDGVQPAPAQAGKSGEAVTVIHSSSAMNATASDEKLRTYYQRVPVHFTTTGTAVTFKVAAADSDAVVGVDDLRITARPTPAAEGAVENTIAFEDFENVDTGYYPFVTGSSNAGGDARTQLAKLHAPFSQSGWYGVINDPATGKETTAGVKGQKYLDNVLDGSWSLLAHQENGGKILRTTEATVPLQYGHSYKVIFDYQAAFDGDYAVIIGHDEANDNGWTEVADQSWGIKAARGTGWVNGNEKGAGTATFTKRFAVTADAPAFIGITKNGGKAQGDLVIDNFRVVDLGIQPIVSLTGHPQIVDDSDTAAMILTTAVTLPEGKVTDVRHAVDVPKDWTLTPLTAAGDVVSGSKQGAVSSVATWKLTMPRTANASEITFTATWKDTAGKTGAASDILTVNPAAFPVHNLFKGQEQLEVVFVDSEERGGEPAPNGYANAAIDDNAATYWHTAWSTGNAPYPHSIVIGVKPCAGEDVKCELNGLEFTHRQGADNGRARGYEIYVSTDGTTWSEQPVAAGEFTAALTPQFIPFAQPVQAKYVQLRETSPLSAGKAWGGAAEIRIGGKVLRAAQKTISEIAAPSASDASTCPDRPNITIPNTEGVVYYLGDKAVSAGLFSYDWGGEATVTAKAADGYEIADGVNTKRSFKAGEYPQDCADNPGSDTPGSDTPGSDTPGSDTPGSDNPGGVPSTPESDKPGAGENPGKLVPPAPELDKPEMESKADGKNIGKESANLAKTGAGVGELTAMAVMILGIGGVLAARRRRDI